jgi:hypothetical protein
MLRRDFLKMLAMAAVMPAMPAVAQQFAPAAPVVHPYQKYIDALALYDKAVETLHAKAGIEVLAPQANELFVFMMDNFTPPEYTAEERQLVKDFLDVRSQSSVHERLRSVPPNFAEKVWPIAVTKALLSEHRMPLNAKTMPGFDLFVERYKEIIIS